MHRETHLRVGQEADAQRLQIDALELRREILAIVRQAHEVARVRPRQQVHHERRSRHVARHRAGDAADIGWIDRHAPEAGL
jgi:hypothetical protein